MRRCTAILVAVPAALGACASPPRGLDSPLPSHRAEALTDPDGLDDPSTIPERIELLESDDPLVRMLAIRSLERMTGRTLGYDHASSELERRRAISRWVAWYEDRHAGDPARSGDAAGREEP